MMRTCLARLSVLEPKAAVRLGLLALLLPSPILAGCGGQGGVGGASGGAGGHPVSATGGGGTAGSAGNPGSGGRATASGGAVGSGGSVGSGGAVGNGGVIGAPGGGGAGSGGPISSSGGASGGRAGRGNGGGGQGQGGRGGAAGGGRGGAGAVAGQGGSSAGSGGAAGVGGAPSGNGGAGASSAYDRAVLADQPVAYWAMNKTSGTEPDLTGNGNTGTYKGGATAMASLPNGDLSADFNGSNQYVTVPSKATLSIPTTGSLTWEAWIRPDVLQFPNDTSDGYVDWMGKCANYSPTCEWQARMYSMTNSEDRCNRLSAYVFNPSAGLGSGAYWQASCGTIKAAAWYHVVGQYTTTTKPADCDDAAMYPGSIEIWVNGVKWNHASHGQTGCLSQYQIVPKANNSPFTIGTMSMDSWFAGAIAKVAIYDRILSAAQIASHYLTMTGTAPHGSCGNTCTF